MPKRYLIPNGSQFGRWTVTEKSAPDKYGRSRYRCVCECGTVKLLAGTLLVRGRTFGCGCWQKNRKPTCHPDRKHEAKGLCKRCYSHQLELSNGHRRRDRELRKLYGITPDEYSSLKEEQGGACRLCGQVSEKNLQVDHCHETGRVRGLLCGRCNKALGLFKDDPALLFAAIQYLNKQSNAIRLVA